jgi:hypothetical protein
MLTYAEMKAEEERLAAEAAAFHHHFTTELSPEIASLETTVADLRRQVTRTLTYADVC